MNRRILSAVFLVIPVALLTSCSGVNHVINCSGATCVNNNGTVSLVLTATPPNPSSQLSIQAFTATVTGITLTPSSGSDVSVPLNATTYIAEFNRVTSDSTILAAGASVPADTYTQVKISFSAPAVTFCTQPNAGVPGCAASTLTSVSGAAGSVSASINLSLGANQQTGIAINVNLGNTLTLSTQTITAVNLGAANVFTAVALPPATAASDLAAGQFSHIDDVLGLVTSVNGTTLTIQTSSRGSITTTANASTQFSADCAKQDFSCVQANTVAVVDSVLNVDGTCTLTFYQPMPAAIYQNIRFDFIEGVVTDVPNSATNQFTVVITDAVFSTGPFSLLSGKVNVGDQLIVGLPSSALTLPFTVVSKGLAIPAGNQFSGSTSVAAVQPGQTVAFPVTIISTSGGNPMITADVPTLALRFSRITGAMSSSVLPNFSGTTLPPFFGLAGPQQFGTTSGRLSLDGVSTLTAITNGSTYSTSALYIGSPSSPQFVSQTVRAH